MALPGADSGSPFYADSGTCTLLEWLEHGDGECYVLTENITWPHGQDIEVSRPVTIETAGFGITIPPRAVLFISGPIRFTGSGLNPIFTVEPNGMLAPGQAVEIRASGDSATAVLVRSGGVFKPDGCILAVNGADAAAIRAEDDISVETVNLSAKGAGSVCLESAGDVKLVFSSAAGEARSVSAGGRITLDGSVISPLPEGAQVIPRVFFPYWNEANPILIPKGNHFAFYEDRVDLLLEAPGTAHRSVTTKGTWDTGSLDFATPGLYSVAWVLSSPGIEGLTTVGQKFSVPVQVVDTARPFLTGASSGNGIVTLRLFDELLESPHGLIVRYSQNGGLSWQDSAQDGAIEIWGDSLLFPMQLAPNTTYVFEVELAQGTTARGTVGGRSNLLKVVTQDDGSIAASEVGGDRDDSDRDAIPPPPFGVGSPSPPDGGAPVVSAHPETPAQERQPLSVQEHPATEAGDTNAGQAAKVNSEQPAQAHGGVAGSGTVEIPAEASETAEEDTFQSSEYANTATFGPTSLPPNCALETRTFAFQGGVLLVAVLAAASFVLWRHKSGRSFFAPLLALILVASLCGFWLLNRYDNKYSAVGPAGANGVLRLDDHEFAERPYLFLVSGWEFYGDALLSPQMLAERVPSPDCFLYLGQYGGFELGNSDGVPFGDATYRLTILTNAPTQQYTLELPEIYSAYQLWINGSLVKSMGITGADSYRPQTQNTSVTFEAGECIELVFAVSNYSSYYSGLVYPPAFGTPDEVARLLNVRFLVHTAAVVCALLVGAICLVVGLFQRRKTVSIALFLLCLCFAGYVGYPVVHTLGGGTAWYALEKLSLYGMLCAVSVLASALCGVGKRVNCAVFAVGAAVCTLTLTFPLFSFAWSPQAMRGYSFLLTAYKWGSCAYLLAVSLAAARRGQAYSKTLTAGICVFGASLLADRLFPLFEPIYTGWPAEWGGLAVVCTIVGILCADMVCTYRQKLQAEEHAKVSTHALEIQLEHSRALTDYIDKNARRNHEAKKQLALLSFYFAQGEMEKLGDYLRQLSEVEAALQLPFYTSHTLVNAILAFQLAHAETKGIAVEANVVGLPATLGISDRDLCALLINLLDNAIAACGRMPPALQKHLSVKLQVVGGYFSVICKNSMPAAEKNREPDWRSGHGYGLQIVREIVKRYDGMQEIRRDEGEFFIHVALRHPEKCEEISLDPENEI